MVQMQRTNVICKTNRVWWTQSMREDTIIYIEQALQECGNLTIPRTPTELENALFMRSETKERYNMFTLTLIDHFRRASFLKRLMEQAQETRNKIKMRQAQKILNKRRMQIAQQIENKRKMELEQQIINKRRKLLAQQIKNERKMEQAQQIKKEQIKKSASPLRRSSRLANKSNTK